MKTYHSQALSIGLAAVLSAVLTACGGGGDSGSFSTAGVASASDPIDALQGTYVTPCRIDSDATSAIDGGPLGSRLTVTWMSKASASKALIQYQIAHYLRSDCGGTALNTLKVVGPDMYLQIDGTEVIATQTVSKTTTGEAVYFPGFSAKAMTVNGVRYTGHYMLQTPQTYRDLMFLQSASWFAGDWSKPKDSLGYPTALSTTATATKQ